MIDEVRGLTMFETEGPLRQLLVHLAEKDGGVWLSRLERFLRREDPWSCPFDAWKTIDLSSGVGGEEALLGSSCMLDTLAQTMVKRCSVLLDAEGEKGVAIVRVSAADLGLGHDTSLTQVLSAGWAHGLRPCRPGAVVQLRMQYKEQPRNEVLFATIEPLLLANGQSTIFSLQHEGALYWLKGLIAHERRWSKDDLFAFSFA